MKLISEYVFVALATLFIAQLTSDHVWGQAVELKILYSFDGTNGASPLGGLTLGKDGNLYGAMKYGGTKDGSAGFGTVFRMTPDGVLTSLVSFNGENGYDPQAPLTLGDDGNLYGTTANGGTNGGNGTVFKMTTNGVLTSLASFHYPNGIFPRTGVTMGGDGNLYGTTYGGGTNDYGTVYQLTTNGVLTTLVSFDFDNGADPNDLILGDDGNLYGTTRSGGTNGPNGTVFSMATGGVLKTLAFFDFINGQGPSRLTPGDDGDFYGTTQGGIDGSGTVFRFTTNGVITSLTYFNGDNGFSPTGLTLGNDGNFYGTTLLGGTNGGPGGQGTVFKVTATGELTSLFSFNGENGSQPNALTLGEDGKLYGTTYDGGSYNLGTVFVVILPPNIYDVQTSSNKFTFSVGSTADSTNRIWFSPNVNTPFTQWQVIATNVADIKGWFQFADTNIGSYPVKFYHVSRP